MENPAENKAEDVRFIDAGAYWARLGASESGIDQTELEGSLTKLSQPLAHIEYADSGQATIEIADAMLEYSYSSVNDEKERKELELYITGEKLDPGVVYASPDNWRKIDSISVTENGERVDLKAVVPDEYTLFFCPTLEAFHGAVVHHLDGNRHSIYILGDLATPRSLLTFLHETGHIFDDQNLRNLGVKRMIKDHEHADKIEKIRRERAASAFAFRAMRTHLRKLGLKDDAVNFLKHYALESYITSTKERMTQEAYMAHEMRGMYDDSDSGFDATRELYESWESWKETPAYAEWKSRPENAAITDYADEYVQWTRWVEETKYNYFKDIYPEQFQ